MQAFFLFTLVVLSCSAWGARIEKPKEEAKGEEEFDGIGIAVVEKAQKCEKTTRKGDLVKINFNGTIRDSTGYFSTRYMKEPLEFVLGDEEMIGGFEAGLVDMCAGELRYLEVPAKFAYGPNGLGKEIPARATLYFYVRLLSFEAIPIHKARKRNVFADIDENEDKMLSRDEVHNHLKKTGHKDISGDEGMRQIARDIFREEDRNSNGFIDITEFSGVKKDEL